MEIEILDKILKKMDENNYTKEQQIEYLKKIILLIEKNNEIKEELYINLILNILMSGTGVGMMLFISDKLIPILLIAIGISNSIIQKLKYHQNLYLNDFNDIEEYRRELNKENEEKIILKKY